MSERLPAEIRPGNRLLTPAEFYRLADVRPEVEWFANITNAHTRRAYENAVRDFMQFAGIRRPEEFRAVTRAHIIAWRDDLVRRGLGGSTTRHRLASLVLFHALRREKLCKLKVLDAQHARKGVPHLKVSGKGGKTRYLPLHPGTQGLIHDYLAAAGHGADDVGALFRPIRNNRTGQLIEAITPDGIYKLVRSYSAQLGFEIGAHALRATAATNAPDHEADIAKVQEWLRHANIATTRIYDHRRTRREDSPTFKVVY
jgi:site-specific recombinase XerD